MIVFDASTLILLTKAELLEKFLASFDQDVHVPRAVEQECCGRRTSLDALQIRQAIQEGKIRVATVGDKKLCEQLCRDFTLGRGEGEAVTHAFEQKARLVGIDDKKGINACKLLHIPFTTAMDILIRMREKGLIEQNEAALKLQALVNYGRYKAAIVGAAQSKLEGKR